MSWINRILVPIDMSSCSSAALSYAVFLAEHSGAHLFVLHVCDVVEVAEDVSGNAAVSSLYRQRVKRQIQDLLSGMRSSIAHAATVQVVEGDSVATIVQAARDEAVDLIVMGKYGDKHNEASHTGNVTAGVAARAHCGVVPVYEPAAQGATFALAAVAANDSWRVARDANRSRRSPLGSTARRGSLRVSRDSPISRVWTPTEPGPSGTPPRWQPH